MGGHTLKRNAEGVPDFLSGREFSRQEIQEIQETVRVRRRLRLRELVQTTCPQLEWVTPAGGNKPASSAEALQQLPARGFGTFPKLAPSRQRTGEGTRAPAKIELGGGEYAFLDFSLGAGAKFGEQGVVAGGAADP